MQIFLSKQCESLTGTLQKGLGYHIEHRKNGFFAKRNQRGHVPPYGHWKFIITCAELAQMKFHVVDIQVRGCEIDDAIREAGFAAELFCGIDTTIYNAREVLAFAKQFPL